VAAESVGVVMRIALIARPGHENTGIGRYSGQLRAALEALGHDVLVVNPIVPLPEVLVRVVQRLFGWDLAAFFNNYPIWARYPQADIYHVTSQNLATLMLLRRPPGVTVVTVHDIIPWLVRNDPELRVYEHRLAEWFDRLALAGLRRADGLLTDSAFTQMSLGLDLDS
jgi:hypothetical protein